MKSNTINPEVDKLSGDALGTGWRSKRHRVGGSEDES